MVRSLVPRSRDRAEVEIHMTQLCNTNITRPLVNRGGWPTSHAYARHVFDTEWRGISAGPPMPATVQDRHAYLVLSCPRFRICTGGASWVRVRQRDRCGQRWRCRGGTVEAGMHACKFFFLQGCCIQYRPVCLPVRPFRDVRTVRLVQTKDNSNWHWPL